MTTKKGFLTEEEYREFTSKMPIATVDCVVLSLDATQVLLGLRNNKPAQGEWYTPGGRLFIGESLDEAVRRIISSEIGIASDNLTFSKVSFMDELFSDSLVGHAIQGVNVYYCTQIDSTIKLTNDSQTKELRWFGIEDAIKLAHPYASIKIAETVNSAQVRLQRDIV